MENILKEFDILMNQATTVTDEFVEKYENYYQKIKKIRSSAELDAEGIVLVPNYFQELALERLKELSEVEVLKGKKDCLIKKVKRL